MHKSLSAEHFWSVKQINIFRDLSEADTRALAKITKFKNLKHEERIWTEGVYLIKEGRVKISENHPDANFKKVEKRSANSDIGENQETKEVLEQGEIFGVISEDAEILNEDQSTFAETLTEVCVGIVTIRDFAFFLKRKPHLALPLQRKLRFKIPDALKTTNKTFSAAYKEKTSWQFSSHNMLKRPKFLDSKRTNLLGNIAFRCASSRLALLLQNLASAPDKNGTMLVPRLSTKHLSKLIGSSTETIDTLLKTFKQHNVIDTRWRQIQILNSWSLKKIADARMRTLSPLKAPVNTSDDDFDLQTLANLQNEGNNQTNSAASAV